MSPQSTLARVAETYNASAPFGRPLVTVAREFLVSQSTATRMVAAAREAGLITPEVDFISERMAAVAAAIDVDPAVLRDAVRDHANGRLTISQKGRT